MLGVWFLVTFLKRGCNSIITCIHHLLCQSLNIFKNSYLNNRQSSSYSIDFDPDIYCETYKSPTTSNLLLSQLRVNINFIRREILSELLRINNIFLLISLYDLNKD